MNRSMIRDKVVAILKNYTRREQVWERATDNSNIISDLKINSARFVDIVIDAEDIFGIQIENSSILSILTINDLIDKVCSELEI